MRVRDEKYDDVTGRRTSGDSSPSITAPLVSTWMTFGAGNDVDVAIVVQAAGISQGHWSGLADNCLLRGCFSYPPDPSTAGLLSAFCYLAPPKTRKGRK